MSKYSLKLFAAALLSIAAATSAFASDDGNTQPKVNISSVGGGISSPQNIIATTNGTGNVKGVQCLSSSGSDLAGSSINIYVNGGSAQTLSLWNVQVLQDNSSNYYISYIPMNVRFTSSIRVTLSGNQSGAQVSCSVSWGLD